MVGRLGAGVVHLHSDGEEDEEGFKKDIMFPFSHFLNVTSPSPKTSLLMIYICQPASQSAFLPMTYLLIKHVIVHPYIICLSYKTTFISYAFITNGIFIVVVVD